MHLAERHFIKPSHILYQEIDDLCFCSKNFYNVALYEIRQSFFAGGGIRNRSHWQRHFTQNKQVDYLALPSQAAQGIIHQVLREWKGYFNATAEYKKNPSKFYSAPRIPKYKAKEKGRNVLNIPSQSFLKHPLSGKIIQLSRTKIQIPFRANSETLQQVRIVPDTSGYWLEVIYKIDAPTLKKLSPKQLSKLNLAAIDLGVSNLLTLVSNKSELTPLIINGNPLKSINRRYNQCLAKEKSKWELYRNKLIALEDKTLKIVGGAIQEREITDQNGRRNTLNSKYTYMTNNIKRITHKRNMRVNNYIHHSTTYIVKQLVSQGISTLVIGRNKNWKQATNLGKKNNQHFVQIPFSKIIQQLEYKCQKEGISVILVNESHTSKCSFLDNEKIGHKEKGQYLGKRVHRGLFKAANGQCINADTNAAANILTKVVPNAFKAQGIAGVLVRPRKVAVSVINYPKGKTCLKAN